MCVPLETRTRLRDMQKIRLGHFSLLCVCVCHCHGHFIAVFSGLCVLFVLSVLRVGWRIVFLMSQMSNVNGIEQHAQL